MLQPIQPAFLDRMEVIRIPGYTTEEKIQIARRHLIPKQVRDHGLKSRHISFTAAGVRGIIQKHTKEAGVRGPRAPVGEDLPQGRRLRVAAGDAEACRVNQKTVEDLLGPAQHFSEELLDRDRIGVATGLAWTAVGGDLLFIEVVSTPGKGRLHLTGQLGEVMKESAQAALSHARAWSAENGLPTELFTEHDLHVHAPAGSVPKDGTSAGITIATAILSLLTRTPVNRRLAMTGEITLRGDILPIGGLKEKVLAAKGRPAFAPWCYRASTGADLLEIADDLKSGLDFRFVEQLGRGARPGADPQLAARRPQARAVSGEDRLIAWLRGRLAGQSRDWLGDDAALLPASDGDWAVSVDQQIEGVHYPAGLDPRRVGRRLVAVCLSDLAATGALPRYCTLTTAVPEHAAARRLLEGVVAACQRHGLELIGGDTASSSGPLHATLTVFGTRPARGAWLRRGAGRAGDELWLGGTVGDSALGRLLLEAGARLDGRRVEIPARLADSARREREARRAVRRHLEPEPQLELGRRLGRLRRAAALDVSDGVALDLHRLCAESGVGAEIELDLLPTAPGHEHWSARLGADAIRLALGGGEDYVLLFALPKRSRWRHPGCHRIGRLTERRGVRAVVDGSSTRLAAEGWDHLGASPRR